MHLPFSDEKSAAKVKCQHTLAWHLNGSLKFLIAPHKAVGVLLLLLAAVRFVWALRNLRRRPAGSLKVKLGHLALYAQKFADPASVKAMQ